MTSRGFKGFAKPVEYPVETAKVEIARVSTDNRFLVFTGVKYNARKASGRSNSLATIREIYIPVPFKVYLERAANAIGPGNGYPTRISAPAPALHYDSKPSVYLEVERNENGEYVAVRDYPTAALDKANPSVFTKVKKGTVIVPANVSPVGDTKAKPAKATAKPEARA